MKKNRRIRNVIYGILRAVDIAAFSALLVGLLFLSNVFRKQIPIYVILFALVYLILYLLRTRTSQILKKRKIKEMKEREELLKLFLLSDEEIDRQLNAHNLHFIRKMHPDESDVIDAIRSGAKTILVAETTNAMYDVVRLSGKNVKIMKASDMIDRKDHMETKHQTCFAAGKRISEKANGKYVILATAVFALSFVTRFKIYYRAVATLCLIIAGLIGIFERLERGKYFLDFLDKNGHR